LGKLSTPIRVRKLHRALYAKAKSEAGYRFYALYDKMYRKDILAHAYAQCRSNKGALGVDGQDFADIEAYGLSACADATAPHRDTTVLCRSPQDNSRPRAAIVEFAMTRAESGRSSKEQAHTCTVAIHHKLSDANAYDNFGTAPALL
jgi:hypothetical protein